MKLANYICGEWMYGNDAGDELHDPVLGTTIAKASSGGLDFAAALCFARDRGGPSLRDLTYQERAALLGQIAAVLAANRDNYYRIALENSGSTKRDAAIDIDGAIFTLKYYARQGSALGDKQILRDGGLAPLSKDQAFQVLHIGVPIRGAAILINAFNFPAWGLWEKAASSILAGVPVLAKPATTTALLAHQMVEDVVSADILPLGSLSIVCGKARELLDHVTEMDAVAFTGSAETAEYIRSAPSVLQSSTRLNIEADSLNIALLAEDAAPDTVEFDLLVRAVVEEITSKAGQKCTAIRRILVPNRYKSSLAEALIERLAKVKVGNPRNVDVNMGPLISKQQQHSVEKGIERLAQVASIVFDGGPGFSPIDADPDAAAFVPPTVFSCDQPFETSIPHELEIFGPVATLLPYETHSEAVKIAALGGGSLVASIFSGDTDTATGLAIQLAAHHGRVHIVDATVADTHTGHGNVMPMSLHGGPGRAGGGSELGGLRALRFFHQYTALQAPSTALTTILNQTAEPQL